MSKKIFVLDTNVILHNPESLFAFADNNILVPIVVIEELDKFKKGDENIHYNAREFMRKLDSLSGEKLVNGGDRISPNHGKISVHMGVSETQDGCKCFSMNKVDHVILNTACYVQNKYQDAEVILVTKDTNLRIKAKAVGLIAQDYTGDYVSTDTYTGTRTIDCVQEDVVKTLYKEGSAPVTDLIDKPIPNEFFILKNGNQSGLAMYQEGELLLLKKQVAFGISPRNAQQIFALRALCDPAIKLVTLLGKAGTGKTLLALASALQCESQYQKILMAKPIVAMSNKDIGYLPGEVDAKISPYMQSLYDNLAIIKSQAMSPAQVDVIDKLQNDKKLEIEALAYMRGRSLSQMFLIVDEGQNLTPHEVKTIITRAGEGTKIIFTGDVEQIDHPFLNKNSNGLSYLVEKMRGEKVYAHITLTRGERSHLSDLASKLL